MDGAPLKYNLREEEKVCRSPLGYTVDDFRFKEEGAVLGCTDEFVNHSRLRFDARGSWS